MTELVALKQTGTVEQYYEQFVSLLNQLHLLEIYALRISVHNLALDIGQYLRLFKPLSLVEAFNSVIEVKDIIGPVLKKNFSVVGNVRMTKSLLPIKGQSQHVTNTYTPTNVRPSVKALSQVEIEDRRKKGLCFWCSAKYTMGHKCDKSQVYQLMVELSVEWGNNLKSSNSDEFLDCHEKLKGGEVEVESEFYLYML